MEKLAHLPPVRPRSRKPSSGQQIEQCPAAMHHKPSQCLRYSFIYFGNSSRVRFSSSRPLWPFNFMRPNRPPAVCSRGTAPPSLPLTLLVSIPSKSPAKQINLASPPVLPKSFVGQISHVFSLFSIIHTEEESICITLPLSFVQDSLTAITRLHVDVFVSCFLLFFRPMPIASLHVLLPFLTQRRCSISPSQLFIPIPDNSPSPSPAEGPVFS